MTVESGNTQELIASTLTGSHLILSPYAVNERVYIEDADVWGRIREVNASHGGLLFLVSWFDDDKCRRDGWFTAEELSKAKK